MKRFEVVVTGKDPVLEGAQRLHAEEHDNRLDAESAARVLAKDYRAFASVYHSDTGESLYEINRLEE